MGSWNGIINVFRFYFFGFLGLITFDTLGQIFFKMTSSSEPFTLSIDWLWAIATSKWAYFVILSYIGSFVFWIILLKKVAVGPAFAASKLQLVTVMIASYFIFDETLSLWEIIGSLFIFAGIVFLAFGENEDVKKDKRM